MTVDELMKNELSYSSTLNFFISLLRLSEPYFLGKTPISIDVIISCGESYLIKSEN